MTNMKAILTSSDREIIDALQQSGPERRLAEEKLFKEYVYFIHKATYKYSLPEEDAFDAYSDTILSAIQTIARRDFEERSSLKTWLSRIFHNKCVDLVRKRTTNKYSVHQTSAVTDYMLEFSDTAKTVVQKLVDRADLDVLREKLDQLGTNCRQMLLLSADGFTDQQIAQELGYKTADVAKTSRLRCLEKLKHLYKAR